jgi:hypothetical protein
VVEPGCPPAQRQPVFVLAVFVVGRGF